MTAISFTVDRLSTRIHAQGLQWYQNIKERVYVHVHVRIIIFLRIFMFKIILLKNVWRKKCISECFDLLAFASSGTFEGGKIDSENIRFFCFWKWKDFSNLLRFLNLKLLILMSKWFSLSACAATADRNGWLFCHFYCFRSC